MIFESLVRTYIARCRPFSSHYTPCRPRQHLQQRLEGKTTPRTATCPDTILSRTLQRVLQVPTLCFSPTFFLSPPLSLPTSISPNFISCFPFLTPVPPPPPVMMFLGGLEFFPLGSANMSAKGTPIGTPPDTPTDTPKGEWGRPAISPWPVAD